MLWHAEGGHRPLLSPPASLHPEARSAHVGRTAANEESEGRKRWRRRAAPRKGGGMTGGDKSRGETADIHQGRKKRLENKKKVGGFDQNR